MSEDNWGDYPDQDIRWPRPTEPSGWGSRASSLACGCTPDRECSKCNGDSDDELAVWVWSKAEPVVAQRATRLGRALSEAEVDAVFLSFVPRRLRPMWADELAEKRAERETAMEASA